MRSLNLQQSVRSLTLYRLIRAHVTHVAGQDEDDARSCDELERDIDDAVSDSRLGHAVLDIIELASLRGLDLARLVDDAAIEEWSAPPAAIRELMKGGESVD